MPFLFAVTLAAFSYFSEAPGRPPEKLTPGQASAVQAPLKSARASCTSEPLRCTR